MSDIPELRDEDCWAAPHCLIYERARRYLAAHPQPITDFQFGADFAMRLVLTGEGEEEKT